MTYIIVRWETSQMSNYLEWRYWRQIKGAFFPTPADVKFIFTPISQELPSIKAAQYNTMEEALASLPANINRVFLEPTGQKDINDINAIPTESNTDIAIICGNTEYSNLDLADPEETYRISTPGSTDLFAHNAVAIALAIRNYNYTR